MQKKPFDRYLIDANGEVSYVDGKGGDREDYLMNEAGKEISISHSDFLSDLASNNAGADYGITQNMAEAFKVFKFAADNSDVEFALQSYKLDNGAQSYVVGTYGSDAYAINGYHLGEQGGYEIENLLFDLHSHPTSAGASGYQYKTPPYRGDKKRIVDHYIELKGKSLPLPLYYIYHKPTSGLYRYTPSYGDKFIKKIKMPTDFYNGKYQ